MSLPAFDNEMAGEARGYRTLLTDPAAAEVWRAVEEPLKRRLRARGLAAHLVDEVAQETALRAARHRVPYLDAADLLPWCHRVAARLVIDAHREEARLAYVVPDVVAPDDVARTVEARDAVRRVTQALSRLPADRRDAMLRDLSPTPDGLDRRSGTRLAVRRHRAREQLRRLSGLGVLLGVLWQPARKAWRATLPSAVVAAAFVMLVPDVASTKAPVPSHGGAQQRHWGHMDYMAVPLTNRPDEKARTSGTWGRVPTPHSQPVRRPVRATSLAPVPRAVPLAVEQRPQGSAEHLVCVRNVVVVDDTCVG